MTKRYDYEAGNWRLGLCKEITPGSITQIEKTVKLAVTRLREANKAVALMKKRRTQLKRYELIDGSLNFPRKERPTAAYLYISTRASKNGDREKRYIGTDAKKQAAALLAIARFKELELIEDRIREIEAVFHKLDSNAASWLVDSNFFVNDCKAIDIERAEDQKGVAA